MNLLGQVEPLVKPRFRLPHYRGMHTARRRGSLCRETSAQTTLLSHHEQSREEDHTRSRTRSLVDGVEARVVEYGVDEPLDLGRPREHPPLETRGVGPSPKRFVGDVECRDHSHAQWIGARKFLRRKTHLVVEVGRQLGDVLRVEITSNRVALAVDIDVDNPGRHG